MTLREDVIIAFSKVPYPGDDALISCNCDECRWEVARFRGKKWTRLSPEDFGAEDGGANIFLLTPTAFRYFLPGLILLSLDHPEMADTLLGRVIDRLAVSDRRGEDARSKVDQDLKHLSERQRQVLIDLLHRPESLETLVPTIRQSAIANLFDGVATPYSQDIVERWLAETDGVTVRRP